MKDILKKCSGNIEDNLKTDIYKSPCVRRDVNNGVSRDLEP